jgi:hypothetical protein
VSRAGSKSLSHPDSQNRWRRSPLSIEKVLRCTGSLLRSVSADDISASVGVTRALEAGVLCLEAFIDFVCLRRSTDSSIRVGKRGYMDSQIYRSSRCIYGMWMAPRLYPRYDVGEN